MAPSEGARTTIMVLLLETAGRCVCVATHTLLITARWNRWKKRAGCSQSPRACVRACYPRGLARGGVCACLSRARRAIRVVVDAAV